MKDKKEEKLKTDSTPEELKKVKQEATSCLAIGTGIGVLGGASYVLSGAFCPLCLIATPALLGIGAYKKKQYLDKKRKDS